MPEIDQQQLDEHTNAALARLVQPLRDVLGLPDTVAPGVVAQAAVLELARLRGENERLQHSVSFLKMFAKDRK